jgi:hypothetical protein
MEHTFTGHFRLTDRMPKLRITPQWILALILLASAAPVPAQQTDEQVRGTLAEPDDASATRAQIAAAEKLLPAFPDRAAVLFFIAAAKQHLGESREALELLRQCLKLDEGFDASGEPAFAGLRDDRSFAEMSRKASEHFPAVSAARIAFETQEKDLIPEGLAWDPKRKLFYLSSLHRKKIVQLTPDGHSQDFVPPQSPPLLPVLGIRLDPSDGSIWANSFKEGGAAGGQAELLHIEDDASGKTKLTARLSIQDQRPHGFNDLVVRRNGEIFLTDSLANSVFRFDRSTKSFSALPFHRPLFYPNGIAISDDENSLFVADALGIIKLDLANWKSADISPGSHSTLAGADGLYWYRGSLIAIQNGIGVPRIAAFRLSADRSRVSKTTILEYRTNFTELPTTGAVRDSDFYFIANSQLDNLNGDRILDITRLQPVRIAVLHLP